MNWFRSRIRSCARLALFALAFQMVVSFGHMHRDDLGLPPLPSSDQTQLASVPTPASVATSSSIATRAAVATQAPAQPANHDHNPVPDDYCPICASMALIATAIPSIPPVLIVPEPIRRVWPSQAPLRATSRQVAVYFQARAPPLA